MFLADRRTTDREKNSACCACLPQVDHDLGVVGLELEASFQGEHGADVVPCYHQTHPEVEHREPVFWVKLFDRFARRAGERKAFGFGSVVPPMTSATQGGAT